MRDVTHLVVADAVAVHESNANCGYHRMPAYLLTVLKLPHVDVNADQFACKLMKLTRVSV